MKRVGAGIAILCCALVLGGVYTTSSGSGSDGSSEEFLSQSTSPSSPDETGTAEEEKEQIAKSQEPITGDALLNSVEIQNSEEQPEHDLAVARMEGMITDDLPSVIEAILAHAKFEVIGDSFPEQLMETLQDAIPDMLPPLLELMTTGELAPLQAAQVPVWENVWTGEPPNLQAVLSFAQEHSPLVHSWRKIRPKECRFICAVPGAEANVEYSLPSGVHKAIKESSSPTLWLVFDVVSGGGGSQVAFFGLSLEDDQGLRYYHYNVMRRGQAAFGGPGGS